MTVTVANVITTLDFYTGDSSTDRWSTAERLDAITEAVIWAQEAHGSELQNFTYDLNYYDGIHRYKMSSVLSDLIMVSDLRRLEGENFATFEFTDGKQLSEDIANNKNTDSYALERYDRLSYLVINHASKYPKQMISSFESTTDGGGTWTLDSTTSDAENLAVSNVNYNEGAGSLTFDADVSNTGNDRASIYNSTMTEVDLSDYKNLSSWFLDVYIPENTNFTSVTLTWGSDTSNYWSATVTTDAYGASLAEQSWITLKFDWTSSTTMTGTPDETAIDYVRIDFNYGAAYADATGFAVDNLRVIRPEKLKLHYLSTYVGRDTNSASIQLFSATTDTPFFSGLYDQYKYAVARYAASVLFDNARLFDEAENQLKKAYQELKRLTNILPSSRQPESHGFKVAGISFARRKVTKR